MGFKVSKLYSITAIRNLWVGTWLLAKIEKEKVTKKKSKDRGKTEEKEKHINKYAIKKKTVAHSGM